MHHQFDGILLASDEEGREYMFKLTLPDSNEASFATRVSGKAFMVSSTYKSAMQLDADDNSHACGGLLMRKFDRSLFGYDFQCSKLALMALFIWT